jgi:CelD/BcsL family acetyltransferase involved in cellulose biosynthesis
MPVSIHTLDPLVDPRWSEFLERHPDASVFHSIGWLHALRRTYGYEPIVYTTSPPPAALDNGLVFCRIDSWLTGRRLVSVPFSDHSQPLADRPEDLERLLEFLEGALSRERWKYIELRPVRAVASPAGFRRRDSYFLHQIDLRPSLDALFRACHKSCTQRKIRRAERERLAYDAGRSEALLRTFYELLLLTCRRKRLPPQPLAWFRHLIDALGDRLTIHVAAKDGRPVASILTVRFKHSLTYKYGGSDTRYNALGGMHLLLWKAIEHAKREGLTELDLGRSDFDTPGLAAFKDRWGAARSEIGYLRVSASPRSTRRPLAMRLVKPIFARMPDTCLVAAGQMLYRHVG